MTLDTSTHGRPDGQTRATGPTEAVRWYACHTRARSEKKVATRLARHGVEAYLPTVPLLRQWADRRKVVRFPLFQGYVFARFDLAGLSGVLSVPGVAGVVRFGGRPAPVADSEIENIRRVVAGLGVAERRPEPQPFHRGDAVRVTAGPFGGVIGVVAEVRGRRRVLVGLHAIGLGIAIDVDLSSLELCEAPIRAGLVRGVQ